VNTHTLTIQTMGHFEARWNNRRLDLRSRHAQSLMAYLALTAGAQHRREKLAGMLWPDVGDAAARQNLRCVLWRINRTLAESAEAHIFNAAQFIFADGRLEVGWLRESPFRVDVDILLRCQPGRAPVSELIQAARAYSGEFLPGFYDEWVSEYREQIAVSFHAVMDALTRRLMTEQRWQETITWANFWIARSRETEEAYRVLMQAQAVLRDLGGVAQTYARCKIALCETLGVEPSPATTELHRKMCAGNEPTQPDPMSEMRDLLRELRRRAASLDKPADAGPARRIMPLIESLCAMML